jgi:hypothetical protein
MRANVLVSVIIAMGLGAASTVVVAQDANPPARETPRPEDLEPRVNTSAPSTEQETSAAEAAADATGRAAEGAAAPAASSRATPSTASGAPASSAAGVPAEGGATNTAAATSTAGTTNTASAQQSTAAAKRTARGKAVDRLELDTTQITGNRELPKVLYIVPWKRSDLGDLVGKPINSLLDEVLTPVDRDVFRRENRYYRALTPGAVANDALSAPDSRPSTPTRDPVPTNSAPAAGMPGSATHPTNGSADGGSTGSGSAAPPRRDEK